MEKNFSFDTFTRLFISEIADHVVAVRLKDLRNHVVFAFPPKKQITPPSTNFDHSFECRFDEKVVGTFEWIQDSSTSIETETLSIIAARFAPWFLGALERQVHTAYWLSDVFASLQAHQRDWVGVYWKDTTGLVVGPYIGPVTPHTRIEEGQGFCGLAVQTRATVNVDDVTADSRFLACSTTTRSEIVIPIFNSKNIVIGELDIDSNEPASFRGEIQKTLEKKCREFSGLLESAGL